MLGVWFSNFESNPVLKKRKDMQLHLQKSKIHHAVRALDADILIDPLFFDGRNSSVGRALDWRSKGPWFNPGFRQCRNTRRSSDFSIGVSFLQWLSYVSIYYKWWRPVLLWNLMKLHQFKTFSVAWSRDLIMLLAAFSRQSSVAMHWL